MSTYDDSVGFTVPGWEFVVKGRPDLPRRRPMPIPKCPACGHKGKPVGVSGDMFFCEYCGALYDTEPEEGGDYLADPSKRMERREEDASRMRKKRR